jgi:hypothetical protein
LALPGHGAILFVPDAFPSVQSAIDSATSGDQIVVATGTYYECLTFHGVDLVLRSTNPDSPSIVTQTILDGSGYAPVIILDGKESPSFVIEGFTITHGAGEYGASAGGVNGRGARATIRKNVITENYTESYLQSTGGGISNCNGLIESNSIIKNVGGIGGAGLAYCDGIIRNNLIALNRLDGFSPSGAGLYDCDGEIFNNTIVNNRIEFALGVNGRGGGLHQCDGIIKNCIIWGNVARDGPQLYESSDPKFCCIQGWAGNTGGNIGADPLFASPQLGNFRLISRSPCIDTGSFVPEISVDLDGNLRPFDSASDLRGDGSDFDIGAYEFTGIAFPNHSPDRPHNLDPVVGALDRSTTPTLTCLTFSDSDPGDSHLASQWQISDSTDFSKIAYDTGWSATELLEAKVPYNQLSTSTLYHWRVRHLDNHYSYSLWGDLTSFTTRAPRIIHIPSDFSSIQEAIDQAEDGDEVVVEAATYEENLVIPGKNLILRSVNPDDSGVVSNTILSGRARGSVILLSGTETPQCIIEGLTITGGESFKGGGIAGFGTKATIRKNLIHGNEASPDFFKGEHEEEIDALGGGIFDCDGLIENNLIFENGANIGAGLYGCDGMVRNNIVYSNHTTQLCRFFPPPAACTSSLGGGISHCNGFLTNNTIYGNTSIDGAPGVFECWGEIVNNIVWMNRVEDLAPTLYPQFANSRTPEYCCIEYWSGGGEGNISLNPLLVAPDSGDFHLTSDSPCIDAGRFTNPILPDYEGNPRPMDGTREERGNGSEIDIGADEFPGEPIPPPVIPPVEQTHPDILYVAKVGYGGEGLSWETAFPTIREALLHAAPGDEIWIQKGVYRESVSLKSGVSLLGGFLGMEREGDLDLRDPAAHPTIIDHTGFGGNVVVAMGISNATLDGFSITGGDAQESGVGVSPFGGGIYVSDATVTVSRCSIYNNRAKYSGGGLACVGTSTLKVIDTSITDNESEQNGGGVYNSSKQGVMARSCFFARNKSTFNGGGYYTYGNSSRLINCIFKDNTSRGGALHIFYSDECLVKGCNVLNNVAKGIVLEDAGVTLRECSIRENSSGGLEIGVSSFRPEPFHSNVVNCEIIDNRGMQGAGIQWLGNANIEITNTTIAGNKSDDGIGGISAAQTPNAELTLVNSILWNFGTEIQGGGINTSHCCIQGGAPGVGNIEAWPGFLDFRNGDYRLADGSPCIDRGNSASISDEYIADACGNPRVIGLQVDIGAFEAPSEYTQGPEILIPTILFVSFPGHGDETGLDWDNALSRVGDGLFRSTRGAEIRIAEGHYYEALQTESGVTLKGGFQFGSADGTSKGPELYPTIIDAAGLQSRTVTASEIASSTLDGLILTGGAEEQGSGLFIKNSTLNISRCRVFDNKEGPDAFRSDQGVGLFADRSTLVISDCSFSNNTTIRQGGGSYSLDSHISFVRCRFVENSGGGLWASNSYVQLEECSISENTPAERGGAAGATINSSTALLVNCYIQANTQAGGLEIINSSATFISCQIIGNKNQSKSGGGVFIENCSPSFNYCTISFNEVLDKRGEIAGKGGGVYLGTGGGGIFTRCEIQENVSLAGGGVNLSRGSSAFLEDCNIKRNHARSGGGILCAGNGTLRRCEISYNHAMDIGGGIYSSPQSHPRLEQCAINNNQASSSAGGAYFYRSSPIVSNCVIFGNEAPEGAGLVFNQSPLTIKNCTLVRNRATTGAGGVHVVRGVYAIANSIIWANTPTQLDRGTPDTQLNVRFSDMGTSYIGEGNLYTDPLFIDEERGDLRLQRNSPCVDTGGSDAPQADFESRARPIDIPGVGRNGTGDEYDMGAYEVPIGGFEVWTPTPSPSLASTPTMAPPPTWTPTPLPCDSGYYLLDSFGGRHRVGNPPLITGPVYFGFDIARDLERATCSGNGGDPYDLVVLDGFGAAHFVEKSECTVTQDFYFANYNLEDFPKGRAVDLEMSADSQGFWVLTDYGEIYRAGSALGRASDSEVGTGMMGVLGFDVPTMRDAGTANLPTEGASLRGVSFAVIDEDRNNEAEGYIVLDSMGGHHQFENDGTPVVAGSRVGTPHNDPERLLDPAWYVWPFFPGLDIARDIELVESMQGVVILDGWGGIHPVPVNIEDNPVYFANNRVSNSDPTPRQMVGLPYLTHGFDDPTTGLDEGDPQVVGLDASSIFKDLEFTRCAGGLYTLDRFGGAFALGAARHNDLEVTAPFTGSPYFYPFLYAQDFELYAIDETGFPLSQD